MFQVRFKPGKNISCDSYAAFKSVEQDAMVCRVKGADRCVPNPLLRHYNEMFTNRQLGILGICKDLTPRHIELV